MYICTMKKTYLLIFAAVIVASCSKELPELKPAIRDGGVVDARSEQPPQSKYEFLAIENTACNTVVNTGQWYPFYLGCQSNANDPTIVPLKVWYREYKWTACVNGLPVSPGAGWVLAQNNCAASGRSKWVKSPGTIPVNTWLSICNNGQPVNPNIDPNYSGIDLSTWELIYSNCSNGIALFWDYQ